MMINLFTKIYYWIQFEIPAWLCKPAMLVKAGGLWLIDFTNQWYKPPVWNNYIVPILREEVVYTLSGMADRHEKEFRFKNGNFIYAIGYDGIVSIGDECLFTGIYNAYNSIFRDGKYFETYIKNILYPSPAGWVLLRGQYGDKIRFDASGDQLTGFLWACSEYKARGNKLPENVRRFLNQFIDEKVLYDENGNISKIGNYKPNFLSINGDCAIFLTACAVADRWDVFEEFYSKYGYKYMLPHASIYLFDDRYKFGKRNWFSCNIAIIALCTLFQELRFYTGLSRWQVYNSIHKILKNNKHNLFFWLLACHAGVISKEEIPQEALSFFETFRIIEGREVITPTSYDVLPPKGYLGSLMPLGLSKASWAWEREPHKISLDNKWVSRLDMVFVQRMKEKYL